MKKNQMKTKNCLALLLACIVSVVCYGQAFTTTGGQDNTPNPIYVHGTATTGIHVGKGANQSGSNGFAENTAVGFQALSTAASPTVTLGGRNTAFGYRALKNNNYGYWNIAIGIDALSGTQPGSATVTGSNNGLGNIAIGYGALNKNDAGGFNTAIGFNSMLANVSGNQNVTLGYNSLLSNIAGGLNCALGTGALSSLNNATAANASENTAVGYGALTNLQTGKNNVALGKNAGINNLATGTNFISGDYNVAIGSGSTLENSIDNQLNIQNCIIGRGMGVAAGTLSGNVGITAIPSVVSGGVYNGTSPRLYVGGSLRIGTVTLSNGSAGSTEYLYVDANNMVAKATLPTAGCAIAKRVPVSNGSALTCSQIYDDGTSVGIGTAYNSGTPNFSYTYTGTSDWHVGSSNPTISSTGNLKLAVDGIVKAWVYYATSDARYKKNIKTLDNAISTIKLLNGVSYEWNKEAFPSKNFSAAPQIGFIAQEVEKIIPQAVIKDKDGYYAMNYSTIIPVLNEGIKEQQTQIESQQIEIENLKLQVAELKNKFNQLTPGDVKLKVNSLDVVPNPITGISVVSYKLDNTSASSILIISDLQGKLLKQIPLAKNQQQGQVQVNKKDLPNGMYVFAIVSGNAEVQSKKVLVSE